MRVFLLVLLIGAAVYFRKAVMYFLTLALVSLNVPGAAMSFADGAYKFRLLSVEEYNVHYGLALGTYKKQGDQQAICNMPQQAKKTLLMNARCGKHEELLGLIVYNASYSSRHGRDHSEAKSKENALMANAAQRGETGRVEECLKSYLTVAGFYDEAIAMGCKRVKAK